MESASGLNRRLLTCLTIGVFAVAALSVVPAPARAVIEITTTGDSTYANMTSASNPLGAAPKYYYRIHARGEPQIVGTHVFGSSQYGTDYNVTIQCVAVDCSVSSQEGWARSYTAATADCYFHATAATGSLYWQPADQPGVYHVGASLSALSYTGTC